MVSRAFGIWLILISVSVGDSVGVFYALDQDLRALQQHPRIQVNHPPVAVGSRTIHRLAAGPHTIYATKMGSSNVEAAMAAKGLLTRFRCEWAVSIGPAGALDPGLQVGEWIRIENVIAWQSGTMDATGFQLSARTRWTLPWHLLPTPEPFSDTPAGSSLASGETFVASTAERARIRDLTECAAVDMNTFGLAMVCAENRVPLFVWRIISDLADENASSDFREFIQSYPGTAGTMIAEWVLHLPPHRDSPESYPAIRDFLNAQDNISEDSAYGLPAAPFHPPLEPAE